MTEVVFDDDVPAAGSAVALTMAAYYTVLSVECDTAGIRVRVYSDSTVRTADQTRALGTLPTTASGVFLEVVTVDGTLALAPPATGYTTDLTSTVPIRIDHDAGSTIPVVLTLKYLAFTLEV